MGKGLSHGPYLVYSEVGLKVTGLFMDRIVAKTRVNEMGSEVKRMGEEVNEFFISKFFNKRI